MGSSAIFSLSWMIDLTAASRTSVSSVLHSAKSGSSRHHASLGPPT